MPLVRGVAITNAVRDTLQGDYVSGCARTSGSIFKSGSDCDWCWSSDGIFELFVVKEEEAMLIEVLGTFIAIVGFAVLLDTPRKYVLLAGTVGALSGFVYLLGIKWMLGETMAAFVSAILAGIVSHILARKYKAPVIIFLYGGILPTVPGAGMYCVVYSIISGNAAMTEYYLTETLQIAGVIALAVFLTESFF